MAEKSKRFTRAGYSFRSVEVSGGTAWRVWPAGSRDHWAIVADIYPATDGRCWIVSGRNGPMDARPSFQEACDLVMAQLPIGAKGPANAG